MRARIAILLAAAHRLPFLAGVLNLSVLMIWWAVTLFDLHIAPIGLPVGDFPATLQHAPVMLYVMLPAFFFGFLLTVFPRWTGYPDLSREQYAPIGFAVIGASILAWCALFSGHHIVLAIALCVSALGWILVLWRMAALLAADMRSGKAPSWHGWSVFTALCFGLAGLGFAFWFLLFSDGSAYLVANSVGTFGFVLPVFFTVAHRMIPFFAGNVVKDYVRWRPYWVLALLWILLVIQQLSIIGDLLLWQGLSAIALSLLTALMLWRWWPRNEAPGLLMVLIWGFAWAPVGFALIAITSLSGFAGMGIDLGRAPVHALYIGMAGSLIIAMVTRVTQGHSGRPLTMNRMSWTAFWGVQLSVIARILAGIRGEHGHWLVLAAVIWIAFVSPWAARQARIYMSKRVDGKAG